MENYNELKNSINVLREELSKAHSSYEKLRIYMNLGLTYLLLSEYEDERENIISALLNFDEAEKIVKQVNNTDDLAEVESNKGFVFYKLAHIEDPEYNLETSAKHYLNAIELLKDSQNEEKLTKLYYNLANTQLAFKKREQLKEAIKYFNEAMKHAEGSDDKIVGLIYHGLGVANFMLAKFEEDKNAIEEYLSNAIKNFEKSLEYFSSDDLLDIASSKSHIASSYFELGLLKGDKYLFDSALDNFQSVLEIYKDKDPEDYGTTLFNIGTVYLNEARLRDITDEERKQALQNAISYFESALSFFPKEDYKESFIRINYELAIAKRDLFFLNNDPNLLLEVKEHIESIINDINKDKNPYTYLTSHFFLGEVFFYIGEKEKALSEYEESLKVAEAFDKDLAKSIKEVIEKVKSL